MSYYIFKPAVDTPETGPVFPQVQKMRPGYNYQAANSVHALSREVEHLPEYSPDLDYFVVNGKAKLTDLLSVSVVYGGFLITPRLKELLEQFNLPIHKFYPAKVSYKKDYFDYFWFHIISDFSDKVDYPSSKFFVYYNYSTNLGNVEVRSKKDLIEKREKIKKDNPEKTITIWAEHIKMNEQFISKLDLFEVGTFDANCYISEELKNAIVTQKITGCSMEEATNLSV